MNGESRTRARSHAAVQVGARAASQWRRKADPNRTGRWGREAMNCPSMCQVCSCPSTAAKFPVRPLHPKPHPKCDRVQASCGSPTMVGKRHPDAIGRPDDLQRPPKEFQVVLHKAYSSSPVWRLRVRGGYTVRGPRQGSSSPSRERRPKGRCPLRSHKECSWGKVSSHFQLDPSATCLSYQCKGQSSAWSPH